MPRRASLVALVVLVALSVAVVSVGATQGPAPSLAASIDQATDGHRFSIPAFETRHLFNKWLGEVGAFVRGRRDTGADADRLLERYFAELPAAITEARAEQAEPAQIAALQGERQALENRVERVLESRVADALRAAGLSRGLPLFGRQAILWPPVDFELTRPPRLLAVSPRSEIRLLRTVLLDPALNDAEVAAIEAAVEADGRFSAIVDRISGVAAYPSIVHDARSYSSAVGTVAHEWVHHYLFFYPLGRAFFGNPTVRTINETTADVVAAEIRSLILGEAPAGPGVPPAETRGSSTDAALRQLRLDVDALLAAGRVAEAEALMERVRLELAAEGRVFRRINQAFFAFNGVYATGPASSSPIGPMLTELRARSASLADFIALVREVTDLQSLEALLD